MEEEVIRQEEVIREELIKQEVIKYILLIPQTNLMVVEEREDLDIFPG
jgi:hypothetical protein